MGVTELALDHVEWPRLRAPSRQRERGGADEGDAVLRAIERTLAGRPENEVIQVLRTRSGYSLRMESDYSEVGRSGGEAPSHSRIAPG